MTCHEMDWIIASHATSCTFAPEAADHMDVCVRCRRLAGVFEESWPASLPSEIRMKRIEAIMLHDLAPVLPLAPERVFLTALALVCLAIVGVGSMLLGTNGWRVLGLAQRFVVFVPLAICAGMLAWSLVRLMVPGSEYPVSPARLPIIVFSLLAFMFASLFHWHEESAFVLTGLGCLRTGLVCAIPAAALFWLFLRRGAILSPGLTGATASGLAGLVSLMVLEVQCPNLNASHILIWHLGITLLAMKGG